MKRTPLARRTPLRSAGALLRKTRLRPQSDKQRAKLARRRAESDAHGLAFHARIAGLRCVVCDRTDAEAVEEDGFGHQAHHAIRQEVLKRLGLEDLLWAPDLAVCVCEEPCHRRHTTRIERIQRRRLPSYTELFCVTHGLSRELEREYPE